MEKYLDQLIAILVEYGPKLIGAIIVLIIGNLVIKVIIKVLKKLFKKRKFDESLGSFIMSMTKVVLQILLWISVLGMVGIEMTSFIALLGAAGLAVGMALSGTLQNFAGGVMILIFKPFKVGDFIDSQGATGVVKEIQIFNTILNTVDNKVIIIPNAQLSNTIITNYSTEPQRRVDWTFGIGYGDSVEKAQGILKELLDKDERILKDPEYFIALSELADSSVNITVRGWVKAADYWGVFFDMNKNVYDKFNQEGINIPFPQMDVHVHNN